MKKKIFISVSALAVVALAAFTGYNAQSSETAMADLLLQENIEALASDDGAIDFTRPSDPGLAEVVKCYCKKRFLKSNICSVNGNGGYCGSDPCSNHDGNCR